ncbi:hypothetical protein RRG08_048604 [Elysia crispata]|uniref:Uncharacterized protein n=1 Tax=Elysia crispata TaxID=231223 RepID=A0AAE1ACT2_9GAST|nr:hypothetical protein RRG08_048604 [Elysia crispata]
MKMMSHKGTSMLLHGMLVPDLAMAFLSAVSLCLPFFLFLLYLYATVVWTIELTRSCFCVGKDKTPLMGVNNTTDLRSLPEALVRACLYLNSPTRRSTAQ